MLRFVPMLAAATWLAPRAHSGAVPRGASCGVERWNVKTLADPRRYLVHLRDVHGTTVRALRRMQPLSATGEHTPRRRGVETTVYRVRARLSR